MKSETSIPLRRPVGRPPSDGVSADAHIRLRVTMERKNRWVRAARARGMGLSEWMTTVCDASDEFSKPR